MDVALYRSMARRTARHHADDTVIQLNLLIRTKFHRQELVSRNKIDWRIACHCSSMS
jgi:hypothetical protein